LRVLRVFFELLERGERGLEARALARELLCLLVIVPKTGDERLLAELVYFSLQAGDVKDAPLAQQGAFGGPRGWRASRKAWSFYSLIRLKLRMRFLALALVAGLSSRRVAAACADSPQRAAFLAWTKRSLLP
jgi:hypothetical protein